MTKTVTIIDPPSGWMYGFPKALPQYWRHSDFDMRAWFIENGYPEKYVELAMDFSRIWVETKE